MDAHAAIFRRVGGTVYDAELAAALAVRLQRNRTPERLASKPSKLDVVGSEARLLHNEQVHQLNSAGEFPYPAQHVKLHTDDLDPITAAQRIRDHFGL